MIQIASLVRRVAAGIACIGAIAASGCVSVSRPSFMMPMPARTWSSALDGAQRFAAMGRYDAADSTLGAFATRYPGTPEALETAYWRALFILDPANRGGSLTNAMALLDAYLADSRQRAHVVEASSLRRAAGQMDVLTKLVATTTNQPTTRVADAKPPESKPADKPGDKPADNSASEAEIKRLKDELAKANAELERIRRRLVPPPPKPRLR